MIELRPYGELGGDQHGWLETRHHFSFANYYDPNRMNWGNLRVWNDDIIAPHSGFPRHPHRDMEIITYVRQGAITHEDSLGNRGRTVAGDVQVMSAGTGIAHSEFNEEDEVTRIFQIWILPTASGQPPAWGTKPFPKEERSGAFVILASGRTDDHSAGLVGAKGALPIRADARLVAATLKPGQSADYSVVPGRRVCLVPASGEITVNGVVASAGDGVAISEESQLRISARQESEIVMVDAV